MEGLRRAQKAAKIDPSNEEPLALLADLSLLAGLGDVAQTVRQLGPDCSGKFGCDTARIISSEVRIPVPLQGR